MAHSLIPGEPVGILPGGQVTDLSAFNKFIGIFHTDDEAAVGADSSRPPPIYRPKGGPKILGLFCETALSASILIHEFPECTPKKCHFSLPGCRSTQAVPNCHAF